MNKKFLIDEQILQHATWAVGELKGGQQIGKMAAAEILISLYNAQEFKHEEVKNPVKAKKQAEDKSD